MMQEKEPILKIITIMYKAQQRFLVYFCFWYIFIYHQNESKSI